MIIKKLLSSLILLVILFLIVWTLMGWYLGSLSERVFQDVLHENRQITGEKLLRAELLDYRKTLMGAKATLLVTSDYPLISNQIGEFKVNAKLLNGPLFVTKSGMSIGMSRWFFQLDETSLTEAEYETLKGYFPKSFPSLIIRSDFKEKVHYMIKAKTSLGAFVSKGIFDTKTKENTGEIIINNFQLFLPSHPIVEKIIAKKINVNFNHQKEITPTYKPGTTIVKIPSLQLKLKDMHSEIELAANVNSNISSKNNYLSGIFKINIDNFSSDEIPVEIAQLELRFKGISADGLVAFSEAQADLDNIRQQIKWALQERGEYPEGQDQIWQLYDRLEIGSKQLPDILFKKALNPHSLIHFEAKTSYKTASSDFSGDLKVSTKIAQRSTDKVQYNPVFLENILYHLEGMALVNLDNDLYSTLSKIKPLKKPQFKLILKGNKLLMQ